MSIRTRGLTDEQVLELAEKTIKSEKSLHVDHIRRLHKLAGVDVPSEIDPKVSNRWQIPLPALKELIRKSKDRMLIS